MTGTSALPMRNEFTRTEHGDSHDIADREDIVGMDLDEAPDRACKITS